jgi:hypothetical protein
MKSKLMKLITSIDREENVDNRYGPGEFINSEIRGKE